MFSFIRNASRQINDRKKNDDPLDPDKLLARKHFLSPKETLYVAVNYGVIKTTYPTLKLIAMGFMAGLYVCMGATVAMVVATGVPEIKASNPGVQKLLFGAVFPVGLILILLGGGELFTGNVMTLLPPFLMGRISIWALLKNWILVYWSNFAGCLFATYFSVHLGGVFELNPYHDTLLAIAERKVEYTFVQAFFRATGCNFLVCLATFLSYGALDVSGKILAMYFPAMTFAIIGFEHSIANMVFIPMAIFEGADITIHEYTVKSAVPVLLGNIIGGGVFVGVANWYIYTPHFFFWAKDPHREDHNATLYEDKQIFDEERLREAVAVINEFQSIEMRDMERTASPHQQEARFH